MVDLSRPSGRWQQRDGADGSGTTPVNSSCNSLLDVIVGGCGVVSAGFNCLATAVNPEQPDVPAGTTVTPFAVGAGNKVPTTTTTNDNDAYSAYFTFAANRAHFTGETCSAASDCPTLGGIDFRAQRGCYWQRPAVQVLPLCRSRDRRLGGLGRWCAGHAGAEGDN